jgi:hypothetical protein
VSLTNPVNVLISGNTVQHTNSFNAINVNQGIAAQPSAKTTNVTVINNILNNIGARGITISQNNNVNAGTTCVDVRGNQMTNIAGQAGDGTKIRLREDANGGVMNVVQAGGAAGVAAANSPPATAAAEISISGTPQFGVLTSCPLPSL